MLILVINSGSSSIKYQLFDLSRHCMQGRGLPKKKLPIAKGIVEKIGQRVPTHTVAIKKILKILTDARRGVIKSPRQISAIGHRVVHGGELFRQATLINDKVIKIIDKFSNLAPLHNPPALLGIRACKKIFKDTKQVAVFDTAFHQTMSPDAYLYGVPYKYYEKYRIRKYGFHGSSHKFVAQAASFILRRPLGALKIITCHLGNGCSITAVKNGVSIDTSMGFTPLEGLVMGTRCGDLDAAVIFYLMKKEHLSTEQLNYILNRKSGLLGLSEISNDMRDVKRAAKKSGRAKTAINVFIYRIIKYIGAYIASMDGVDAVVLTGGIGENDLYIRKEISKRLSNLLKAFKARVLIIQTNEELMIAKETYGVITKKEGLR